MANSILATKLYIPPPRPNTVPRPRLLHQLNQSHHHKLTLISAPAGFGKTTLLSNWIASIRNPQSAIHNHIAWLSLDENDNDPARFLTYLISALQTISAEMGHTVLSLLQSPQPPAPEAVLTALLNDIATIPHDFILVLDDYHLIESPPIDQALAFLLQHLPPQMHLIIATREDPQLPLARLRGRGQLTELRAQALRFTPSEAAEFLTQVMGLTLTAAEIAALETRTEGWIAGLQLAALSMQGQQGHKETADFIQSFTGSHHFVLDYLVEEVLHQQPAPIQTFLLHTALLNRLCAPLCDAVLGATISTADSQATLAYLERANLFIIPLDDERRWYRYHHLFGDLLRQRLAQSMDAAEVAELHGRASLWYEANGLDIEAFHHATAAPDLDRAEYLIEGQGRMPLQFRGGAMPILTWLQTLPTAVLDARPALWVAYASTLLALGRVAGVEEMAQAAEDALAKRRGAEEQRSGGDSALSTQHSALSDLVGRIASIRATVAVTRHDAEGIIAQGERALAHLRPENVSVRASITWALGYAYHLQGQRTAASRAYTSALATCEAIGHKVIGMMSAGGLGHIQEVENQLHLAAETYQRAIAIAGEPPTPPICDTYLGLARLHYQWNDLAMAAQYGEKSLPLARQIENTDRFVACELFLAQLKLAQGDVAGAAVLAAQASQSARQHNFAQQMDEVAAVQIQILLAQGQVAAADQLAQSHAVPLSRARVALAQGRPEVAIAVLEAWLAEVTAKAWADERLKGLVLLAVAYEAHGEEDTAVAHLREALATAEPGGFIRLFVDEGRPMAALLGKMKDEVGSMRKYIQQLLAEMGDSPLNQTHLPEPLSERELEILRLVAEGLSNREIGARLFLALDTVKGHNRKIFEKLQVQRRTEAVARGREWGLL
ncbi:MAG: LuxR C-terminal-related transcriptional regulator [Chloroflexi bacterium]|nr:LuxR C-terminal-related transcriptional regulator [Chloroflexota bacterium]